MQRKWYVICTQQKMEKKVSASLFKKGIENFCPFISIEKNYGTQKVRDYQPLFNSYVFACLNTAEAENIKHIPFVINFAYWKCAPVTISSEEINAIKMMAANYINITLKKSTVRAGENVAYIEQNITTYKEYYMTIQPYALKVMLPSLGFVMIAEREKAKVTAENKGEKRFLLSNIFSKRQGAA